MSSIDLITMAIKNLFKRKIRTFLTILGVVIGSTSIIVMISLGLAMNESFKEQVKGIGSITELQVFSNSMYSNNKNAPVINNSIIEKIKNIDGVVTLTPVVEGYLKFVIGKNTATVPVKGIYPDTMESFFPNIESGRILTKDDENSFNIVFGGEIPYNFKKNNEVFKYEYFPNPEDRDPPKVDVLNDSMKFSANTEFGNKNPNSSKTPIKSYKARGIGVLSLGSWNTDYSAFMSLTKLEKILAEQKKLENKGSNNNSSNNKKQNGYHNLLVKCENIKYIDDVKSQIEEMGFSCQSNKEIVDSIQKISKSLQGLLGAIGAVSFIVAAIGITNTMIMSIYERTREIGIMKVIGAQIKDIKNLFLIEASVIGFIGGILGILISLLISLILNNTNISFLINFSSSGDASKISIIPIWLCLSSLLLSTLVGLSAGYLPAKRAVKIEALKAIKSE